MVSSRSSSHKRFSLGSHLERTALTLELVRLACGFLPNLLFRRVYHVRVWGRRWVVAQVFVTSLRVRLLLVLLVLPTARPLCCVYACVCACLRVCVIFTIGLWCEEDWREFRREHIGRLAVDHRQARDMREQVEQPAECGLLRLLFFLWGVCVCGELKKNVREMGERNEE